MKELTDQDRGEFEVVTESGAYYHVTRYDAEGPDDVSAHHISRNTDRNLPPAERLLRAALRQDGYPHDLLWIQTCAVGQPAVFHIVLENEKGTWGYVSTTRTTTNVTEIRRRA